MRLVTLDQAPNDEGQPLFVEFVNTLHWYEGAPVELIGNESDFAAWLLEHGLPATDVTGWLPEIHLLREHVRGLTGALASRRAVPEADMAAKIVCWSSLALAQRQTSWACESDGLRESSRTWPICGSINA